MSKILKFASTSKAIQYLSNFTNSRVIIAASLKRLMPKLVDRLQEKSLKKLTQEEAEEKIRWLANADPNYQGNENRNLKHINVILEWYLNNPKQFEGLSPSLFSESIKEYNRLLGSGKTKRKLKEFNSPQLMYNHLEEVQDAIEKEEAENLKKKILAKPDATGGNLKAYEVDYDWEKGGAALFEDQTKWCVNEESNYDHYKPMYLFTQDDHYFALYSPSAEMFNDKHNNPIDNQEIDLLYPLLEKLGIEEEASVILNTQPDDDEMPEYADVAWDSWAKDDFIFLLNMKFDDKLKDLSKELNKKIDLDKINERELWYLFNEAMDKSGESWDWEEPIQNDEPWTVSLDMGNVVSGLGFQDVARFFYDEIERKISKNEPVSSEDLNKYKDADRLRKKYPKYFKELAEEHGQTKLQFSSVNEAIQYLSNYANQKIIVLKKETKQNE